MDDLISKQAVAKFLDDWLFCLDENCHKQSVSDLKMIIKDFKNLPSAQPKSQWTPCNEEPPIENGRYLVTRGLKACGALWKRTYIANYSDLMGIKSEKIWWQGNVGKSDFERLDDVLAWMPLPEPYEVEQDEN